MMTLVTAINFTDQGSRTIKDGLKRVQAARVLANRFGIVKNIYLTSGDSDLLSIVEAPNGDSVAKMAVRSARQVTCTQRRAVLDSHGATSMLNVPAEALFWWLGTSIERLFEIQWPVHLTKQRGYRTAGQQNGEA
jgi:uncharacterized protein with GYD domain